MHPSLVRSAKGAILLHAVTSDNLKRWLPTRGKREAEWVSAANFTAKQYDTLLVPGAKGIASGILGLGTGGDPLALAAFSETLPPGVYALGDVPAEIGGARGALAWVLGTYQFDRYRKKQTRQWPKLVLPSGMEGEEITRIAEAVFLARDLVNTPSNDMGPEELASAAREVARKHGAKFSQIVGEELIAKKYPLIHAVGRGSVRAPRLIDFSWGDANAPKVTLVGKGVVFDSGGLDLKPSSAMLTMKKDMGGAAVVLAVARMVMDAKLKLRLRVLIPAVENSLSGSAYRPGDVLKSRKGLTIEIGNTDAEGRLVLADSLTEADSEVPELLIDVATLTGAARAATGMELPPFFTDDEMLAADLMRCATEVHDPLWRLPLWRGYESAIASPIADLNNSPDYNLAGATTAALFLNRFVTRAKSWVHFDIPAWVDRPKPGRRKGAEANGARAIYALLKQRYA
ncbi:MAG TPA: leucyl aminopeptidase family protein [Rhizomicrobium sp.]|jgi:leucyl aminopeptidase|nr:leucyl aminopeptidase family protein [Rhizomicrobium sp.]